MNKKLLYIILPLFISCCDFYSEENVMGQYEQVCIDKGFEPETEKFNSCLERQELANDLQQQIVEDQLKSIERIRELDQNRLF